MMLPENSYLNGYAGRYPRITLIGMSGLGKSYWSKALEAEGFKRFCCDDMIADRLAESLNRPGGETIDLGKWMGFPYDSGYREREKAYLALEVEVLKEILAYLKSAGNGERFVLDTTGSAPYAGASIMNQLSQCTTVIHLATSEAVLSEMLERYIQHPRPVLWGDRFTREPAETDNEALKRSYASLLAFREKLYKQYAHHTIPYEVHRI